MNNASILIVEDEQKTAEHIREGLEENGYHAEIASDGMIGKNMFLTGKFNLVILDLNLPVINGFDLCFFFRNTRPAIPILMLTALGSMDDKIAGFDVGADDYLVKPFELRELLVRIRALLKRAFGIATGNPVIIIGNLQINIKEGTVFRGDKKIYLTPKEFALLVYMAQNEGRVISREEISDKVWNINFDTGTNIIDVFIAFLRKKIDKDYTPRLIHTVYAKGFVLRIQSDDENEDQD